MTNENTKIVETHHQIDLRMEAMKQIRIATVDSIQCCKKPTKDFLNCVVDMFLNQLINWVDSKLSV